MTPATELLFLGLPETGKTTFFVALDDVLIRQSSEHGLVSGGFTSNRTYIENAKRAWRSGNPVGRTLLPTTEPVELLVKQPKSGNVARLAAPDVNGEFFDDQWIERKWLISYRERLEDVSGILLFLHAASSGRNPEMTQLWKNVPGEDPSNFAPGSLIKHLLPLKKRLLGPEEMASLIFQKIEHDAKSALLKFNGAETEAVDVDAVTVKAFNALIKGEVVIPYPKLHALKLRAEAQALVARTPIGAELMRLNRLILEEIFPIELPRPVAKPWDPRQSAKQVKVVELLQFILSNRQEHQQLPIAVIVSAWDLIEPEAAPKLSPENFLAGDWSLLAQFLAANDDAFRTRIFGVSARGGDDSAQKDLVRLAPHERVWLKEGNSVSKDLTRPIRWLLGWD